MSRETGGQMRLGVALSGGGHRATLFGLGVLLYLSDVSANGNVVSISSVSGGSITNAFAGLHRFKTATSEEFEGAAADLARQVANRGSLFAWWGTKVYLALLALGLLGVAAVWLLPLSVPWRFGVFVAALMVWDLALVRRRGQMCGRAYAAEIFRKANPPNLSDLGSNEIDHVICATHLNAGEHFYFSGSFVYAYRFGWGRPGNLPLHVAVQASTALPGAFPPRWIRTSNLGFEDEGNEPPRLLGLVDGGVYDNMAEQWLVGASDRTPPESIQTPKTIVVANASASMGMEPTGQMHIPILGELLALLRDTSIMYDNSASIRKQDLVAGFDRAAHDPRSGLAGCLLDIASDPYGAATAFVDKSDLWPERAARARSVLNEKPSRWESDARFVSSVKTGLSKLGVETSARILHHAYTLTAMNLHLFLGLPLVEHPSLDRFTAMCTS